MTLGIDAFRRDGALKLPRLFGEAALARLRALDVRGPGSRLQDPTLPELIAPARAVASELLGGDAFPVRAVLFDKTVDGNWAVGWHQDRAIPVRERVDVEGFGPWSRKDGILHAAPPVAVLERMATLRIHIDPVDADNAPLVAALGTHRIGMTPAADAAAIAERHPQVVCFAEPGDVWAYSTPILHASERACRPRRRRVLQVDFAVDALPGGLEWAGIGAG
ncbi:MAG: phytanoyl-CoA dioxygenase family protein [Phenylobacterium sp.]|nr:phytanoyl-CoA dioxygenase family protein [Phenylobacterium sp.]